MKAVVRAQDLREECLRERRSMLIETVFSAPDKLDFIRRVKEADFFIRFLSAPTARTSTQPVSSDGSWMAGTMFPFQKSFRATTAL